MSAKDSVSSQRLELIRLPDQGAKKLPARSHDHSLGQKTEPEPEPVPTTKPAEPAATGKTRTFPESLPGWERLWDERNRTLVLTLCGALILTIALLDWRTAQHVSLGFLYVFPIMLAAAFLPREAVVLLGVTCALLAERFSPLATSYTRLSLEILAIAGCGLFVAELARNHRMNIAAEERLRVLVETSPAAIVTVDKQGFVELANRAAVELMAPRDGRLRGNPIAAFLPELHHALRWEETAQFRASMKCRGQRGDGESFMAEVWFSTYNEGPCPKLAAIIGEIIEDPPEIQPLISLNPRELDVLRLLVQGLANKEIAVTLEISESAVKNTLQQLFTKTGVRTRSHLVRVALERCKSLL